LPYRSDGGAIGVAAVRGGLGDILAGGVASVALGVFVFPLGFGLLLAIPLAIGIYAGLVLLLPSQINLRPRSLGEPMAAPDEPPALAEPPPPDLPAVDESVASIPAHIGAARQFGLTRREHEIVILLTLSHPMMTDRELAADLSIAFRTAENHVARILDKLGLKSRREIPAFAAKHGLLPPTMPSISPE
jgi:DNA-binding CsgD family transcriptional regulator